MRILSEVNTSVFKGREAPGRHSGHLKVPYMSRSICALGCLDTILRGRES